MYHEQQPSNQQQSYHEQEIEITDLDVEPTKAHADETELATSSQEPMIDDTNPTEESTELSMNQEGKEIQIWDPPEDTTNPEVISEELNTDIMDLAEWRASTINLKDTAMDLKHHVIDISEMEEIAQLDIDSNQGILDQPILQENLDQPLKSSIINLEMKETNQLDTAVQHSPIPGTPESQPLPIQLIQPQYVSSWKNFSFSRREPLC